MLYTSMWKAASIHSVLVRYVDKKYQELKVECTVLLLMYI